MASPAPTHINRMDSQTRKRRIVNLMGYFEFNGAASPTVVRIPGVLSSAAIVYAATGKLLVKLDSRYTDISVLAAIQIHTFPSDVEVVVSDIVLNDTATNNGNTTILLQATTSSTGAAVAPPASVTGPLGNRCHLWISACLGDKDFSSAN